MLRLKMSKQTSHRSKTIPERVSYQNYIKEKQEDSTVDDSLNFHPSSQAGSVLSQPTSKRKREIPTREKIKNHLIQHWIEWLVAIILAVMVYFVVDAKVNFAVINTNLVNQQKQMDKLETSVNTNFQQIRDQFDDFNKSFDDIKSNYFSQEMIVNEIKIRVEYIEKQLQQNK
jgi:hypothetical protein